MTQKSSAHNTTRARQPTSRKKNVVDALASPKRRGLIGAIEDIRDEIGEEDPEPDDLLEALTVMVRDIEPRGKAFLKASQVVRVFLTQPVGPRFNEPIEPMTLGNMRANGVRSLAV
jgi:hypothetical protein